MHWRGGRLLAAEVLDDQGQVKGVRPLGGTVQFGETAEAAVVREFREELGITVRPLTPPLFVENIYTHEGCPGHEILAIFDVEFPAGAYADSARVAFDEDNGVRCIAEWFSLDELDQPGGPVLYPAGLKARLRGA